MGLEFKRRNKMEILEIPCIKHKTLAKDTYITFEITQY